MDFFTEQDQARRSTKVLVLLFLLSVVTLVLLTNILVVLTLWLLNEHTAGNYFAYQQAIQSINGDGYAGISLFFSWQRFGAVTFGVTSVIAIAILFKWLQLSGGGKRVAEQLDGRRILPNTTDAQEKRVLNVVEEMSLASGMPVPPVYMLDNESGINAFAAGSTPADAVIGITRGAVEQFSREQLQGVIAHECSHILNGDMRLNIRLIAILHGILFVGLIGEVLLRGSRRGSLVSIGSRRKSGSGNIALLGFALLVIGWLGRFFGNWIKSAVSRQREFLADASAVQFTRNPSGIGDALKIIGGYSPASFLDSTKANEMSHLFFGQAVSSLNKMFATHPPLSERISRIEPRWDGQFIQRGFSKETQKSDEKNQQKSDRKKEALVTTATVVLGGEIRKENESDASLKTQKISSTLIQQVHEPFSAIAAIFALLLSHEKDVLQKQIEFIELAKIPGLSKQTLSLSKTTEQLSRSARLPLIQLALPALKCMSTGQYKVFCKTLLLLIRADKKYELFEWCIYQLIRHYLDPEYNNVKSRAPKYKRVDDIAEEFTVVLSLLCYNGELSGTELSTAFSRGANTAGLYTISLLEKNQCDLNSFIDATNTLADCYPLLKPRLLKALSAAANQDGHISSVEEEMISAIAAIMDSPIPALH